MDAVSIRVIQQGKTKDAWTITCSGIASGAPGMFV